MKINMNIQRFTSRGNKRFVNNEFPVLIWLKWSNWKIFPPFLTMSQKDAAQKCIRVISNNFEPHQTNFIHFGSNCSFKMRTNQSSWCFSNKTVVSYHHGEPYTRTDQISCQNGDLCRTLTRNLSNRLCVCLCATEAQRLNRLKNGMHWPKARC